MVTADLLTRARAGDGQAFAELAGPHRRELLVHCYNCQTVVFTAYVTARSHTPFDFRLYLPKTWCADAARRRRARVPDCRGVRHQDQAGHRDDHRPRSAAACHSLTWPAAKSTAAARSCARVREEPEGLRARGPGELHGHAPPGAEGDRGVLLTALASATSVNAELIGRPDLGRVAEGCVADLLIVDGNICDDPPVVWSPDSQRTIVQDGRVIPDSRAPR